MSESPTPSQTLFKRRISLIIYGKPPASSLVPLGYDLTSPFAMTTVVKNGNGGIDLSNMHIQFSVRAPDVQTPKSLVARIFNLSPSTVRLIQTEFTRVVLQAGYENSNQYGKIFDGTITQLRTGRDSGTDTFLEIYAGDGDAFLNYATINATLDPIASSPADILARLSKEVAQYGGTISDQQTDLVAQGGILPRGKVMFGMYRDHMRSLTKSQNLTWFVENGQVTLVKQTGYLPDEIVKLDPRTGLLDFPEATIDGLQARCLLNPKIKVGRRVQINQELITTSQVQEQAFPNVTPIADRNFANTTPSGIYRVIVIEHEGDTRGEEWSSNLVCLQLDATAPVNQAVPSGSQ